MIWVLQALNSIQSLTHIPVHDTLRILDAFADVGTIFVTGLILLRLSGEAAYWPMLLVTLAPSWAFISGFHVNSDPLMVFFLVLTVYFIDVRHNVTAGAMTFALASGIKVVPVLLLPALLLYLSTWAERVRVLIILAAFWAVTALPWLTADYRGFLRNIFGYGSIAGHWGFGWILTHLPGTALLQRMFTGRLGRYAFALLIVLIAVELNHRRRHIDLFRQFGVLLFSFILLTPGFGIQYLAWLTPWLVVMPLSIIASYVAASGVFCAMVYTYWSGGIPWWYANSVRLGTWRGVAGLAGFITWITIFAALEVSRRQITASRGPEAGSSTSAAAVQEV